jgi:hypothetical protein
MKIATRLLGLTIFGFIAGAALLNPSPTHASGAAGECAKYKVYYIDPATQFISPPVPLEDNAQKIFCSSSAQIGRLATALDHEKPIKKRASDSTARIKIVPVSGEPMVIHNTGEVVRQMNTYHPDHKLLRGVVNTLKSEASSAKDGGAA